MAIVPPYTLSFPRIDDQQKKEESLIYEKYDKFISTLPQSSKIPIIHYLYRGFWFPNATFFNLKPLTSMLVMLDYFQSRVGDIILATLPKVGTTWLKALAFAILDRKNKPYPRSLLLSLNPHQCVPFLEYQLYSENRIPNLDVLPSPRLFATHIPYSLLPPSIVKCEGGKIVYLCRNPKDALISMWKFANNLRPNEISSLEEFAEAFLSGVYTSGPYWDNVIEYWKASIDMPDKVLFMRYEELKRDPNVQLKRLAKFIGHEFSEREEKDGVVEEIVKLCSLESLKGLEVNQSGATMVWGSPLQNKAFFRKGEVGNYAEYMSPQMIEQFDKAMEEKLKDTGLSLE